MENVVITGMGCVSSLGNSPELLWQNLLQGKSGIAPIQRFDASAYTSRMASEIREFDASEIYSTRDQSRFSRCIQYAVYSAFQALRQAGIAPENENPERCGAIIGSSIGGLQYCYDAAVALSTRGPSRVSPLPWYWHTEPRPQCSVLHRPISADLPASRAFPCHLSPKP